MLTMQPLSLTADRMGADGSHRYRVKFDRAGTEVEHIFTVDSSEIPGVIADDDFIQATFCDPLAPILYQAILNFHESRLIASSTQTRVAKTA